jgi:hypothetical protein
MLVRYVKKTDRFENLDTHGTKLDLRKQDEDVCADYYRSEQGPDAGSREHGKELLGFHERWEISLSADQLTA